jgi:phosphoglycerate kinase
MKFLHDIPNPNGKTVLLRADLDEPHDGETLLDDYRIRQSLPSIQYLLDHGAKVIVISKIGRPKKSFDPLQSLAPAARRLAELLNRPMATSDADLGNGDTGSVMFFTGDIRKPEDLAMVKDAPQHALVVLENIRFYPEEENCDPNFAALLASLGDFYVNDAFAMSHRSEVSVSMLPKLLPAFCGMELEKELNALQKLTTMHSKPYIAIMGGAKISDKVETIRALAQDADQLLIGGALANLFLKAKGFEIGLSFCESDKLSLAEELLRNFKDIIVLPTDVIVSDMSKEHIAIVSADSVKPDQAIYDIGPKTILAFSNAIKTARKMVWNGPVGLFEEQQFSTGTMSIGRIFAARCQGFAYGVAGGGDTLEAINQAQIADQLDFVSTGGGAMLDYLAGKTLPGIAALG